MEITHLSPSSINRFLHECPRKWLYEKLGVPGVVKDESRALYGKAVHNIMVIYFDKIGRNPSEEEIENVAKEAFEEGKNYAMEGFGYRTNQILKNFIDFEKKRKRTWKQYKPTFIEKRLEVKPWSELPTLVNVIDAYWEEDGAVVDWKTGNAEMSEEFMVQGKVNETSLKMNGYKCERVFFYGLYNGRLLTVPKITDGWLYKLVWQMAEMVKAEKFPKRQSGLCEYCPFQLRCEFDGTCLWWEI